MTRSVDIARCSNGDWTEVELGCQSSFHASQSPKCTQLSFQAISFGVAQHDSRPLMQHIPGRNWEAVGWTFGHTHTQIQISAGGGWPVPLSYLAWAATAAGGRGHQHRHQQYQRQRQQQICYSNYTEPRSPLPLPLIPFSQAQRHSPG